MKSIAFRVSTMVVTFALGASIPGLLGNSRIIPSVNSSPPLQALMMDEEAIEEEEYAVYSALINQNTGDDNVNRAIVINDRPSPWISSIDDEGDKFYEDMKKSSPALLAETVDDLKAKNKERLTFSRRFVIKRRYVLVSEKELEDIFKKGGGWWEEFYRKYPETRGFSTFSRVGFNGNRSQALVYQAHSCGGLCGGGSYLLLVKEDGVWKKVGEIGPTWVS